MIRAPRETFTLIAQRYQGTRPTCWPSFLHDRFIDPSPRQTRFLIAPSKRNSEINNPSRSAISPALSRDRERIKFSASNPDCHKFLSRVSVIAAVVETSSLACINDSSLSVKGRLMGTRNETPRESNRRSYEASLEECILGDARLIGQELNVQRGRINPAGMVGLESVHKLG